MSDHSHRGAKIGPRVAMLVSQAIVATHQALLGTKHKLAMALFNSMSDQISEEVHQVVGPYLMQIAESETADPAVKAHAAFMAHHSGQLNALAGVQMTAGSLLSSLAMIVNNAAAPVVRDIVALTPNMALDPATLAGIVAHGINSAANAEHDVAGQGFNSDLFGELIELAHTYPGLADALDMWRRGIIDDNGFNLYLARNGIPESEWNRLAALLNIPLAPADAALAVLRSEMTQEQGAAIALKSGVTPDDFATLIANTGEPLGLMQLLEAKRRNFIDDARLVRGIVQSRIRNEWVDVAEKLAYSPMSVSDAVNAVVQNQLDEATAASYAQQNGLEATAFPILINTAGEPLSRTEMEQLYNRGLATETQVKQASRESRLKNKYNDLAFALHEKLLEPRMLSSLVQYGSLSVQEAVKAAMEAGYSEAHATALVGEGSARKLETYKNRVISAIETLYEDGAVDNNTAAQGLTGLGLTSEEGSFILEAADMRRATKQTQQLISVVRVKYVGHHITGTEATNILQAAGIPSAQVDYLAAQWQLEQSANVRSLTEAQIAKAVKLQLISPDDGKTRLVEMGYLPSDADLLLQGA